MNITRRTDYAIRILLKLASNPEKTISVREIAEAQDVPYSFARGIQRDLAHANLVETSRGVSGGVSLARPAQDITLYEVVDKMQGPVSCATCVGDPEWCARMPDCQVHQVWRGADGLVREYLESTRLSDLV